jgi:hypothetical protein
MYTHIAGEIMFHSNLFHDHFRKTSTKGHGIDIDCARRRRKGLEAEMIFPLTSLYIHVYVYNRHMGHGPGWSYYILYTPPSNSRWVLTKN